MMNFWSIGYNWQNLKSIEACAANVMLKNVSMFESFLSYVAGFSTKEKVFAKLVQPSEWCN